MSALFDEGDPSRGVLRHGLARAHDPRRLPARACCSWSWKPTSRQARLAVQVLGRHRRARRDLGVEPGRVTSNPATTGSARCRLRDRDRRGHRRRGATGPRADPVAVVVAAAAVDRHDLVRPLPLALADQHLAGPLAHRLRRHRPERAAARRHVRVRDGVVLPRRAADPAGPLPRAGPGRRCAGSRPPGSCSSCSRSIISTGGASKTPTYFGVGNHPTPCPDARAATSCERPRTALRAGPDGRDRTAATGARVLASSATRSRAASGPGLKVVGRRPQASRPTRPR